MGDIRQKVVITKRCVCSLPRKVERLCNGWSEQEVEIEIHENLKVYTHEKSSKLSGNFKIYLVKIHFFGGQ